MKARLPIFPAPGWFGTRAFWASSPTRNGMRSRRRKGSRADIPGAGGVGDRVFLGVAAKKEGDAVRAAKRLRVEWSDEKPPFPDSSALYDHIRKAQVRKREVGGKETGNVDEVFKTGAR